MLTTTHLVFACALLTKPHQKGRNASIVVGALTPDISMAVLTLYAISQNVSGDALWKGLYWQDPWQSLSAISNSFPLYWSLYLLGYLLLYRQTLPAYHWLASFALAALFHLALDFPFHVEDAHQHFWPLSDWRFQSSLSYWDEAHHAGWVNLLESAVALVSCLILWTRFRNTLIRIALGLMMVFYLAIPSLRYLLLTGH